LEQLVDELSLPMNKISNWFHNARMRTKPNTYMKDINKISSTPLTDNNDDDDDEDNTLPAIVPLNNSWFNTTNDSDTSTSPVSLATSLTNIISLIDEQKPTLSISTFSSSSKKRKSIPQKIITTKKLHNKLITENDNYNDTILSNQTTNESTNSVATNT
ncbi:unnamed protein product, partial [Adineta steineri]